MVRFFRGLAGFAFLTLSASAQSIYVDFGPANSPSGQPTPNYGGSVGVPGYWNAVGSVATSGLRKWDGQVTDVSLSLESDVEGCVAFGPFIHTDDPTTTGQDEALLDDRYNPGQTLDLDVVFSGLRPGTYDVDTIVPPHSCGLGSGVRVEVVGSPDPTVRILGLWSGNYVQGQNFARHTVAVTDGTLRIKLEACSHIDYIEVAGIQLHYGDPQLPDVPFCFGDGSVTTCPCANDGLEGHGCQNSAGTGGAVLFATGTTSPDTVVLRCFGELPSPLSIFLQGDANVPPLVYGDGLRCTAGAIRRLYAKNASGGESAAPTGSDPSITQRSAALGVPITAGTTRYYQVFYRDPNPAFCPMPTGSTFNVSHAVAIDW